MMKKSIWIFLLLFCLLSVNSVNSGVLILGRGAANEESSSSIPIFYFNCDSATSGQSPQITQGSETITIGSNVTTTTGAVGNALVVIDNTADGRFELSSFDGIFNIPKGQIGLYLKAAGTHYGRQVFLNMKLYTIDLEIDSNNFYAYHGSSGNAVTGGMSSSEYRFFTVRWDDSTKTYGVRRNNGSWVENTTDTASYIDQTTITDVQFVGATDFYIDQIMVFDNHDVDVYELRDETSFS